MWIVADDSTIDFCFNTSRFSTGAPFTLAGTPSIAIRVDGNATEVTAGITLTVDFDSITGYHKVVVDLSASASYVAGARCEAFIAAGTVDSVSAVGKIIKEWIIGNTGSQVQANTRTMLALPAVAPAANGGLGTVDANNAGKVQAGTGTGQLDFTSGVVKGNTTQWNGSAVATPTVAGVPEVDVTHWNGSTTPVTNINIVFNTDFASNYNTTLDQWNTNVTRWASNAPLVSGIVNGSDSTPIVAAIVAGAWPIADLGNIAAGVAEADVVYDFLTTPGTTPADVWAAATRTLTAATNITSTGGTTVPQTGDTFALANGASGFVAIKADTAAILIDTGTSGVVIDNATQLSIADNVLIRDVTNTQNSAGSHSLTTIILATLESSRSGTTWSINKTTGALFVTKTLTEDGSATPVVGVT